MGLDHEKLTYYYHGFDHRPTCVRGKVIRAVLA
jgi:hypothetical protein